ncbi:hypothetical protein VTO42DRAFT_4186 [Malbranchea cinnamomea]
MSSIARPPDPCLVAIVLIVRLRAGPRFVFHYPPNPSTSPSSSKPRKSSKDLDPTSPTSDIDAVSSSDDEDTSTQNPAPAGAAGKTFPPEMGLKGRQSDRSLGRTSPSPLHGGVGASPPPSIQQKKPDVESSPALTATVTPPLGGLAAASTENVARRTDSGHGKGAAGLSDPPWETFMGLKTDVWEKLLCPAPAWHKRRFEVGVNDLTFVGWPVFARENGMWKKRRRTRKEKRIKQDDDGGGEQGESEREADRAGDVLTSPRGSELANMFDSTELHKQANDQETPGEDSKGEMTMFNVVFVLNPPILEYHLRVKEKYENVIKKFGKGLKSEQARADYVWTEVQKILHIKEKAREEGLSLSDLYSELLSKSSLAQAIATVHNSISNSRIASVTLTPETTMSLQIPPLTSTSTLPSATEPSYPGLWLTTADSLSATDEASGETTGPTKVLAKHFALLLLVDEATILKDIEASTGSIGQALAHYIRCSKPNKSFAQISAQSQIPLTDIQILANHLVYWRRARAIPPLNQRDTYIVSPNADLSKLGPATAAYEATFPTLPSLPKMLSALSGTPRPYSSFIPSKDHKQVYLDILAWLMRGGWVTQLRTFGWIKVDPEVKKAVAEAMAREEEEKEEHESLDSLPTAEGDERSVQREVRGEELTDGASTSSSSLESELSGDLTPIPGQYSSHRQNFSRRSKQSEEPTTSSLILHPHRASPLESRWLDEILARVCEQPHHRHYNNYQNGSFNSNHSQSQSHNGSSFGGDSEDASNSSFETLLRRHWPAFIKYFNGTDALEKIPVREGLKRKLVWKILSRLDISNTGHSHRGTGASGGGLEVNPKEKVLLTVRHW